MSGAVDGLDRIGRLKTGEQRIESDTKLACRAIFRLLRARICATGRELTKADRGCRSAGALSSGCGFQRFRLGSLDFQHGLPQTFAQRYVVTVDFVQTRVAARFHRREETIDALIRGVPNNSIHNYNMMSP